MIKLFLELNPVYCCNNTIKDVDLDLCKIVACFILSSKPVYCYNSVCDIVIKMTNILVIDNTQS